MKLILTGKSAYSDAVEKELTRKGHEITWMDESQVSKTQSNVPVIFLSGKQVDPFLTDDAYVESLIRETIKKCKRIDFPVVFLLDQEQEASAYLISLVLKRALALTKRKQPLPVLVAATTIRCGVAKLEHLYREVRQSGVVFLKYDTVTVKKDEETNHLTFVEGGNTYEIDAPILVECEEQTNEHLEAFAKKMRLRKSEGEAYSQGRWFLPSGFTGRRNVWILDDTMLMDHEASVLQDIVDELAKLEDRPTELSAVVDDQKCAFCYTCYRVCPHGAPKPDEEKHAMTMDETLCAACGMCRAICPAGAISLQDVSGTPKESSTEKVHGMLALCCSNSSALIAEEIFAELDVDVEVVDCGGEINETKILEGLKKYEKVFVAVCQPRACKHFNGTTRCRLQVERAWETLEVLGEDPKRVALVQASFAAKEEIREAALALQSTGEEEKS
jgi:Pyruvate/2-oxoacid:ferredoxin oxidoreductase delta subunit/coenzyme F420-reducing hydrogenase delta subunit